MRTSGYPVDCLTPTSKISFSLAYDDKSTPKGRFGTGDSDSFVPRIVSQPQALGMSGFRSFRPGPSLRLFL